MNTQLEGVPTATVTHAGPLARTKGIRVTIPTRAGVRKAYAELEREMFGSNTPERYAAILALTRSQLADHSTDEPQRLGGHNVAPLDPAVFEHLAPEGAPIRVRGRVRQNHWRAIHREKTARELADDEYLAIGLQPTLADLPIQQMDAIRAIHWRRLTQREAASHLSVDFKQLKRYLSYAYRDIRAAIPVDGYRTVRAWLISRGKSELGAAKRGGQDVRSAAALSLPGGTLT